MTDDIIIVIPTLDVYVGPKTIAELAEAGATTPAAKASKRQHGARVMGDACDGDIG